MRLKVVSVLAALVAVTWSAQFAQAGAIRYVGKELHKAPIAAVQKTSGAAGMASGEVKNAGKAARTTLKNGRVALRKGATSTPGMAIQGTKGAVSKIWNAVW
jgi:hypothetical protein